MMASLLADPHLEYRCIFFERTEPKKSGTPPSHHVPAIYADRSFATDGGLISYGGDAPDVGYRLAASYVDRILRGEEPADLPVQALTRFELVINPKTAQALGLTISESFLNL